MKLPITLLALCLSTIANGQTMWDHNGSIVQLEATGLNRRFIYETPRAGLPVARGTQLFIGKKDGNSYAGTAYLFSVKCGPVGYSVSGPVSADQRTVTMQGRAPLKDENCRTVGYRDDNLVFNFRENEQSARGFKITVGGVEAGLHIPASVAGSEIEVQMVQDEHFAFMVEDALKALGKPTDILVLESPGLRNGFAFNWSNPERKVVKVLVFDPIELEHLRERIGGDRTLLANLVSALFTLGHEIGHHVCGHVGDGLGSKPWKELQADRVSGFILSRSGWREFLGNGTREDYEAVMRATLSAAPSATHPGIVERIKAFREGWMDGRGCE